MKIYSAPKAGEDWRYSMMLVNLYRMHPWRVRALFDRKSFSYRWSESERGTYTEWKRRDRKAKPLP